jgi:hypothetical protein
VLRDFETVSNRAFCKVRTKSCYEGLLVSPSSPRPLLLSHSSYFWPSGMVAP